MRRPSQKETIDTELTHDSMKHDAIVEQGIPIHERVEIPEEMIPEDSRVEIDAKIHAGYCKSMQYCSCRLASLLTRYVNSHKGHDHVDGRASLGPRQSMGGCRPLALCSCICRSSDLVLVSSCCIVPKTLDSDDSGQKSRLSF